MKKYIIFTIVLLYLNISISGQSADPPKIPDGYCSNFTLKLAYFFGTLDLIDAMPPIPDEIIEYKDLVYKEIHERSLKLDIYHLKELTEIKPVLVFIHGGAWKKGNKKDYRRYLVDYAKKGYVSVTVQYSLANEAKFPAALNDINCAIRWIKANSEKYFMNPNKIAVIGGSAGGHLAMMLGYSQDTSNFENDCLDNNFNSSVQAIVNIYGPSDLTTEYAQNQSSVQYFLGKKYIEDKNIYSYSSPISYLTPDDPPTLIFHGTLDELVPISQSDSLKNRLDRVGIAAEYHRLEGWPHTMDLGVEVNEYCQYYMDRFFERYIPYTNSGESKKK
jgi:acetyl esterase/lipase